MALTEEGQLVDPVCLIQPTKGKEKLSVKGSDYVRVNNVGRMSDYKLLGDFLKNVPFQFVNEIDVISQYFNVPNDTESAILASTEIESMNDLPEKHEQRVQFEEGKTVLVNLGPMKTRKKSKSGLS